MRRCLPLLFGAWLGLLAGCATRAPDALYHDLGGQAGLEALVDEMLLVFAADPRVAPSFEQTEIRRFRRLFVEHLCELTGGPCRYSGETLRRAHAHLRIDEALFNAVVEDLQLALQRRGYPQPAQNRLLQRLAALREEVLSDGTPLDSELIELPPAAR